MKQERIRRINELPIGPGPIVYFMNRELRTEDNWALLYAQALALEQRASLLVVYNLVANYLGGGRRQRSFKIRGLQEISENLAQKSISFFLILDDEKNTSSQKLLTFFESIGAGAIVTDFSPIRIQLDWVKELKKGLTCSFQMVDAHNIVPAWVASDKQEYAAYTIRPKLYRLLPEYLDQFPPLRKHPFLFQEDVPTIEWGALLDVLSAHDSDLSEIFFVPGEQAGQKMLERFLRDRLSEYGIKRNDALASGQSDLSPYLHYGMLAPQRVALSVVKNTGKRIEELLDSSKNKAKVEKKELSFTDHAGAFLEELIVRRELSDNFCFYNKNYDTVEGFPDWARRSLDRARSDKRMYLYTDKEFEQGVTHDDLWNASQKEMVRTGKMHGYMRMYWAKKILEWTKSPEEAMRIALSLNDRYELDGRDPNGYAGIAWSIGGVHDRAWFPRPVFGTIRYMARSGAEKKFDVKGYIAKWNL